MTAKPRVRTEVARKLAGLVAVALFSVLPEPVKAQFATLGWMHRFTHIAAFCVVYLVLTSGVKRFSHSAAVAILLIGIGAALELLQTAVYGNALEYWDIRDDACGVLLGASLQRLAAIAADRIMASKSR